MYSKCMQVRVESGSDDPDNLHLGHFLKGQVHRSHPQTKLFGCDSDIIAMFIRKHAVLPSGKVHFGSDECIATEISLV